MKKLLYLVIAGYLLSGCVTRNTMFINKSITLDGKVDYYFKKIWIKPKIANDSIIITVKSGSKSVISCKKLFIDGKVTINFEPSPSPVGPLAGIITITGANNLVLTDDPNRKTFTIAGSKFDLKDLVIKLAGNTSSIVGGFIEIKLVDIVKDAITDTAAFDGKKILVDYDTIAKVIQSKNASNTSNCTVSCLEFRYKKIKSKSCGKRLEWPEKKGDSNAILKFIDLK